LTNEKSRITPKPGGPAPHENSACPAGAEADTSTATAATASTGAFQATLMTAQELGQPVMDRLAFIAIIGGSIVVAPLVRRPRAAARQALPGDARRHLVQILLQVLDLRATLLDGDPHEIADRQHGQETVATDDG
jgi:hypothetical protein